MDGVLQPGKVSDLFTSLDMRTVVSVDVLPGSEELAPYGEAAVRNGAIHIVTFGNEDKVMPRIGIGKTGGIAIKRNDSTWNVSGGDDFDSIAAFDGSGNPGAFERWLLDNAKDFSPGTPVNDDNYGAATVSFEVTRKGKVKNVRIIKGERSEAFNSSVINLVSGSPAWVPARKNGRPVKSVVTYPVHCYGLIR